MERLFNKTYIGLIFSIGIISLEARVGQSLKRYTFEEKKNDISLELTEMKKSEKNELFGSSMVSLLEEKKIKAIHLSLINEGDSKIVIKKKDIHFPILKYEEAYRLLSKSLWAVSSLGIFGIIICGLIGSVEGVLLSGLGLTLYWINYKSSLGKVFDYVTGSWDINGALFIYSDEKIEEILFIKESDLQDTKPISITNGSNSKLEFLVKLEKEKPCLA